MRHGIEFETREEYQEYLEAEADDYIDEFGWGDRGDEVEVSDDDDEQ